MNKLTETLKQHTNRKHNPQHVNTKHRIIKLSHKILTKEQMKVLNLGPQFTMKPKPKRHKKYNYHTNRESHQTYRKQMAKYINIFSTETNKTNSRKQ